MAATPQFTSSDIQKLFGEKLIVVIGDSVQRSVYKDLVCLLKANQLLKLAELKEKGEESFQGDTLLEGGVKTGLHNGTNYREVRKFTHEKTTIMFYFVTRCYNDYMQSILDEFKLDPPHVIIMNSCLWDLHRYGKNANVEFIQNIRALLESIDLAVPYEDRLFIWNATLPVREKVKAGFLPPGVSATLPAEDIRKANLYVRDELKQCGKRFIFLDLHKVFYRHLYRRVKDGVHWDDFAHRKITCLLLSEISRSWNFEVPSKAPMSPILSDISPVNFSRPMSAVPPGSRHFPRAWPNGPPSRDGGYPARDQMRHPLNTTYPPFLMDAPFPFPPHPSLPRKRKFVEDEVEFEHSYKYPRKYV